MDKKKVCFFTIADKNNERYAQMLTNSFRKFHKDIDLLTIKGEELEAHLKEDPQFYYRATPIVAKKLIKEYDLVVKIDADSIVCDDLSYIWETKDYDIGTVMNWNRKDPALYGYVQGWGILPAEYFNCGLVAMRNPKFIHDWRMLCFTQQFYRLQYKEQDLLNAMIYYGNWNVRCFDHLDPVANMNSWWGLISKGEWMRTEVKDNHIIVPKGLGDTPFPPKDIQINVIHWAGGSGSSKMNYKTAFPEDVIKRIDYLVSEES